jgi:hypothetical protein
VKTVHAWRVSPSPSFPPPYLSSLRVDISLPFI